MAHAVGGHPIHWHVDPNIKQEIEFYNARRRKNQAGWGARDTLAGEGFKVWLGIGKKAGQATECASAACIWAPVVAATLTECVGRSIPTRRRRTAVNTCRTSPRATRIRSVTGGSRLATSQGALLLRALWRTAMFRYCICRTPATAPVGAMCLLQPSGKRSAGVAAIQHPFVSAEQADG